MTNFSCKIFEFFSSVTLGVVAWLTDFFSNPLWEQHSSYNLGVAITAIAIVVTFIEFIANKNELRFKLNYQKRRIALCLAICSILLVFLGEFELLNRPFLFEILGAASMFSAILIYLHVVFNRPRKLGAKKVLILQDILAGVLSNSHSDVSKTIKGCVELFDNLLYLSLENKQARDIFRNDFSSDIFLEHFSESYYVFSRTIEFYIDERKKDHDNLDHIKLFLKQLFVKSLENEKSFLNMFVGQKIYPDALFSLDDVMLKEKDRRVLTVLFGEYRFNKLSETGQLNYIAMVNRYLRLIYRENNHVSLPDGYQKNYDINEDLVSIFLGEIEKFFESCYDQTHLETLLDRVEGLGWYYERGVRTQDKSEELRKRTGTFLYEIFFHFVGKYEIKNEEIFRLKVHRLYDHFLEMQENVIENNVAYTAFTKKLKEKILGGGRNEYGQNYKGYYPAMILIYFYMFGFYAFSEKRIANQDRDLHIPIFSKLAESFPKFYQGYKQEFYEAESLPEAKKEMLQKQGREIIDSFIKENMVYSFEENSLSYYYSGNIHSAKIYLDRVRDEQKIEIEKV